MLQFLSKQIRFNSSFKKQALIGALLGGIVVFVMIFLQPFDTNRIETNNKYLIFSGFGFILSLVYILCSRIESIWYKSKNQSWTYKYEALSFISFVFVSGLIIHFYNQVFLNDLFNYEYAPYEYLKHGLWFFVSLLTPLMLVLLPFYLFLRNNFGEIITPASLNEIEFSGINKGEKIVVPKEDVLFVKASENYVKICYTRDNTLHHETFRNTLTAIKQQAPYLYKSHRSYLVNVSTIKDVTGNSQNARIEFHQDGLDIPLSKSYYQTIKSAVAV